MIKLKRKAVLSFIVSLLNLIPIALIWLSAWSIYLASLALNHYTRESGRALSAPAVLMINTSKMYGPYLAAILFTLLLIISQVTYRKYLHAIQVGLLCLMLLYACFAIMALMTPFMCLCDAWQQW